MDMRLIMGALELFGKKISYSEIIEMNIADVYQLIKAQKEIIKEKNEAQEREMEKTRLESSKNQRNVKKS